jgi:predicted nucleic acid-binding protein
VAAPAFSVNGDGSTTVTSRVYAAVTARGRKARGCWAVDLLIAATALAQGIALFTCNPDDFEGPDSLIEIVPVGPE